MLNATLWVETLFPPTFQPKLLRLIPAEMKLQRSSLPSLPISVSDSTFALLKEKNLPTQARLKVIFDQKTTPFGLPNILVALNSYFSYDPCSRGSK